MKHRYYKCTDEDIWIKVSQEELNKKEGDHITVEAAHIVQGVEVFENAVQMDKGYIKEAYLEVAERYYEQAKSRIQTLIKTQ